MMCKKTSSRWAATKALLVVPMVAVALSAFATTEYVPRDVQDKVTENSVNIQDEEKPNPIVVVNGEKISYDEMSKIDPNTIHSMNVYKDYSKLPKELKISEDEAKNGVIVITLKKDGEGDANVAASEKMIVIADKRESGPQTQTQSSTVSILGNTDATEMTTVKVSTKDGEKPTIIINGEEVPYASLSDIQSDTVESMDVYKLEDGTKVVYIALESNTTKDGFETKKQEFEQKSQQQDMPYIKVEKMPTFQGGDLNRFAVWMQGQIQYPAEAMEKGISGRVIFSFVVEKDGSMSDFTVLASPDKLLSAEVERVFNSAPKAWTAGEENGQKVRVKFTVPIVFAPVSNASENVSGLVVDAEGKPFIGVIVQVDGSDARGVVTDAEGKFSISMSKGETLKFSYIGMDTKRVKVNNTDKPLSVTMK